MMGGFPKSQWDIHFSSPGALVLVGGGGIVAAGASSARVGRTGLDNFAILAAKIHTAVATVAVNIVLVLGTWIKAVRVSKSVRKDVGNEGVAPGQGKNVS